MCSDAAFLIALFLLFKGGFRIANRTVTSHEARQFALLLMIPFLLGIYVTMVTLERGAGTSIAELVDSMSDFIILQMLLLIGVVAFILYRIYSKPQTSADESATFVKSKMMDVMTPAESADYLRVSESEVRALIEDGKLPAARIGGDYRIARRAIDDYLSSERNKNPFDDV